MSVSGADPLHVATRSRQPDLQPQRRRRRALHGRRGDRRKPHDQLRHSVQFRGSDGLERRQCLRPRRDRFRRRLHRYTNPRDHRRRRQRGAGDHLERRRRDGCVLARRERHCGRHRHRRRSGERSADLQHLGRRRRCEVRHRLRDRSAHLRGRARLRGARRFWPEPSLRRHRRVSEAPCPIPRRSPSRSPMSTKAAQSSSSTAAATRRRFRSSRTAPRSPPSPPPATPPFKRPEIYAIAGGPMRPNSPSTPPPSARFRGRAEFELRTDGGANGVYGRHRRASDGVNAGRTVERRHRHQRNEAP